MITFLGFELKDKIRASGAKLKVESFSNPEGMMKEHPCVCLWCSLLMGHSEYWATGLVGLKETESRPDKDESSYGLRIWSRRWADGNSSSCVVWSPTDPRVCRVAKE
ncbi:hypothetical protein L1987_43017 [Smallanthus sonchifolius]|uniref:Uncharacterized protein n=1 Tax=Smallanthus sonchifolius TaxID=185202 RepID=A0ACB9GLQ0_9ASTR|nr:hypothetical protein L1987_43017 [Smallanthus sonchifolius]